MSLPVNTKDKGIKGHLHFKNPWDKLRRKVFDFWKRPFVRNIILQKKPGDTKRDLFVQGVKENLKIHLQLRQLRNYQEAVRAARVKNYVSTSSDNTILMKEIIKKLKNLEREKKTGAATISFVGQPS